MNNLDNLLGFEMHNFPHTNWFKLKRLITIIIYWNPVLIIDYTKYSDVVSFELDSPISFVAPSQSVPLETLEPVNTKPIVAGTVSSTIEREASL